MQHYPTQQLQLRRSLVSKLAALLYLVLMQVRLSSCQANNRAAFMKRGMHSKHRVPARQVQLLSNFQSTVSMACLNLTLCNMPAQGLQLCSNICGLASMTLLRRAKHSRWLKSNRGLAMTLL